MDFAKMIEAARAENANGIEMRRGKKYTSVAVRVEIFRRHCGSELGVETEVIQWGSEKGSPIVVRAVVRDTAGNVIGSGYAEEIRGQGQVNSTSALENAETSAIGRALACLGLSGGEFASAKEMEAVDRKAAAPAEPASGSQSATSRSQATRQAEKQAGAPDAGKSIAHGEPVIERAKRLYIDLRDNPEQQAEALRRQADLVEAIKREAPGAWAEIEKLIKTTQAEQAAAKEAAE
ncbi:hypothetical protein [Albimonas pacifica]|uniref:Uncharacterized protein n=1 Tax=Albimonas pacifica TaxID=1114924 RepID=A0A1I3LGA5_9RHOB|nr:hypothetical protein [Albimonas pacifica]SFI83779.1 hypothetical protein SAMN05216258_11013 [Albimonas pacifica]